MTRLSVNINKVATLRNARGGRIPDVQQMAVDCERFGAEGITVHPRPDQRHITYRDVELLKPLVTTEFNIEGYPSRDFLDLVTRIKPDQVTLVPDPPDALTSNAGWDTVNHASFLKDVVAELKAAGCRVSIFIDTDSANIEAAPATGTDRIELYTEPYAKQFAADPEAAVRPFAAAARLASGLGLGINAGHDLNTQNLHWFVTQVPNVLEVSIGHALWSDALYYGIENTIQLYRRALAQA